MKYKVGDKVRILDGSNIENYRGRWIRDMEKYIGNTYEIDSISSDSVYPGYYLRDVGYIWDERGLELVNQEIDKKIIITTDGKTTTARLYNGKTLEKESIAKCHPDDEFDFEKGADYAFKRLFKTYYTGKVVCSDYAYGKTKWTVGKVYTVKDGVIADDEGRKIVDIESVKMMNWMIPATFIELVEE